MVHVDVSPGGYKVKLLICFVFAAGFGGVELYRGLSARKCLNVDLSRIEAGESLPGNWIRTRGRALWSEAGYQTSDKTTTYFVPVVSEQWTRNQPIAMFLLYRLKHDEQGPSGPGEVTTFEGTVEWWMIQGLGSRPRQQFHDAGLHEAKNYFSLNPGAQPGRMTERGVLGLSLAGGALILIPVVGWFERKRKV
jgi:hypothetical protein